MRPDVFQQIISEGAASDEKEGDCCALPEYGVISPDMTVAYVLEICPRSIAVFRRLGLNCCACVNAHVETIRSMTRFAEVSLSELLRELNVVAQAHFSNVANLAALSEERTHPPVPALSDVATD